MKITKEEKELLLQKHKDYVGESSLAGNLFKYFLSKKLLKDKGVRDAIEDFEQNQKKIRDKMEKAGSKEDIIKGVPKDVRKYLGFDY